MNQPEIPHLEASLVDNAVSHWRAGGLVAIPTETVYGLAADATNGRAVAGIYEAKSRPQFNPLIVHVADVSMARQYAEWNDLAETLAAHYWPGPLTLVLKRRADSPISELVSAGGDTLALRMPAHPMARQLLRAFGGGLAAPSANRSGRVSPTTADHVVQEFGSDLLVIDGGPCLLGIESTVIDTTGSQPVLLRPGSITGSMITTVAGPLANAASAEILRAPGQLASHYAPSLRVRLNATQVAPEEALLAFGEPLPGAARTLNLSASGHLGEAAANLFAHMRALDDPRFTAMAVMPIPQHGIGIAINDRLQRAAA